MSMCEAYERLDALNVPLEDPSLHALQVMEREPSTLNSADYWRKLCPKLTVSRLQSIDNQAASPDTNSEEFGRIESDGYFIATEAASQELVKTLGEAVVILMRHGWPPSFIAMFDETHILARKMQQRVQEATHSGNVSNLDILAWYVHPEYKGREGSSAGFSPHRDRQPDDVAASFHSNGAPKYTTSWLALTDAHTDNSCLYIVPRFADPGYTAGDTDEDPLQRALHEKECYQNVRSLAVQRGGACFFSHRILHWGSRGRKGYAGPPRIALSMAFSDESYEKAYICGGATDVEESLELRFALCCAQMLIYHQRFSFGQKRLKFFFDTFKTHEASFEPTYAKKVRSEFVAAVQDVHEQVAMSNSAAEGCGKSHEAGARSGGGSAAAGDAGADQEEEMYDSEAEEAALDAMLEAETRGDKCFTDDFDEIAGGEGLCDVGDDDDEDEDDEDEDDEEGMDFATMLKKRPASDAGRSGKEPASTGSGKKSRTAK